MTQKLVCLGWWDAAAEQCKNSGPLCQKKGDKEVFSVENTDAKGCWPGVGMWRAGCENVLSWYQWGVSLLQPAAGDILKINNSMNRWYSAWQNCDKVRLDNIIQHRIKSTDVRRRWKNKSISQVCAKVNFDAYVQEGFNGFMHNYTQCISLFFFK